jgi:putative FmdB family regulatory protein
MPIYEYECDACGIRFERLQRITEDSLTACPECTGQVHRVLHPVGIIFKGKGFYVTDHKVASPTAVPGESRKNGDKPHETPAETDAPKVKTETPAAEKE